MIDARASVCCACLLLGACAGDGSGLDENGRPIDEESGMLLAPTLASIQSNVFTPICAPCHSGASAPVGLSLAEGASYAMLVNAPSVESSGVLRVAPGAPDASYLVQKIEGSASVGARMPLNAPSLSAEVITVIRQWISDGAAASSAAEPGGAVVLSALSPEADAVLTSAPAAILLSASAALDVNLLDAGVVRLRASGGDGDFSDGDEIELPASIAIRSLDPTVFAIEAAVDAWKSDRYELRLSGGAPLALADLDARSIDGDRDGRAGGDFVLRFQLEASR